MTFFEKIKAFFTGAGVQLTTQQGEELTPTMEAQLENSIEFQALIQKEQSDVIATQAQVIAEISERIAKIEAAQNANLETIAAMGVEFQNAIKANEQKSTEVAQAINKMKGAPLVEPTVEDPSSESMQAPKQQPVTWRTIATQKLGWIDPAHAPKR